MNFAVILFFCVLVAPFILFFKFAARDTKR